MASSLIFLISHSHVCRIGTLAARWKPRTLGHSPAPMECRYSLENLGPWAPRGRLIRRFPYGHPRSFRSVRDLGVVPGRLSVEVRTSKELFIRVAPSVAPRWPDRPFFRPDTSQVGADRARVMRRGWLRVIQLIPSWLRFAELQCVNGFREFPGAPGAAAELAEDLP